LAGSSGPAEAAAALGESEGGFHGSEAPCEGAASPSGVELAAGGTGVASVAGWAEFGWAGAAAASGAFVFGVAGVREGEVQGVVAAEFAGCAFFFLKIEPRFFAAFSTF